MKLVDLNLLLYAVNRDSPFHATVHPWLDGVLRGTETVALTWTVLLGFIRITTRPGAFAQPLKAAQAFQIVDDWLGRPSVSLIEPRKEHWRILKELLEKAGTAGNLTTDAHLAALAIEHGARLCSSDNDFARFRPQLDFFNPLQQP